MLLPAAASPSGLDVALLGIPYDGGTSYRAGARFGPRAVREQSSLIRPWHPVLKVHPFERLRVADCGDVDVVPISIERTLAAIERRIDDVLV
ncbi:MAG: agmatinase, partial [Candidatus Rokuibacteriota bacterium]